MTALVIFLSLACDPMPNTGEPFARADIASVADLTENEAAKAAVVEAEETKGPVRFSEWAGEDDDSEVPDQTPTDSTDSTDEMPTTVPQTVVPSVPTVAKSNPSSATVANTQASQPSTSLIDSGWPLVVVKTLTDLNPPRAILGLPSGEELVVKPGQVLEAHKLVVMSIGVQRVDIVHISQQGDRAALTSQSLPVQN